MLITVPFLPLHELLYFLFSLLDKNTLQYHYLILHVSLMNLVYQLNLLYLDYSPSNLAISSLNFSI